MNRGALPSPDESLRSRVEFVPPETKKQVSLSSIYSELLGMERVGLEDNFFDLGGHSLLAVQLISRIRHKMSAEVALRWVFEGPTVRELAHRIESVRA